MAYIQQRDEAAAERVRRAIARAVARLGAFPLLGRPGRLANTRERPLSRYPYTLVYRIYGERMFVLRAIVIKVPAARKSGEHILQGLPIGALNALNLARRHRPTADHLEACICGPAPCRGSPCWYNDTRQGPGIRRLPEEWQQ